MSDYSTIQKEETLKAKVFQDYFGSKYVYDPNIDNIDFIVADVKTKVHYLWAEAKKGEVDEISMITQLILTCKKTYDSGDYLPPPFIGCFDAVKIVFVPFHDILPIFTENDINWNATPSNYLSDDFIKIRKKVAKHIIKNIVVFSFNDDDAEIKSFIKTNFIPGMASSKSPITKNNFPHIYNRWVKEVKPTINISNDEWFDFKKNGILDCDFFIADMMSKDGMTIIEKLKIVLEKDTYKLQEQIKGRLFSTNIDFTDRGLAYHRFWNKYERPPAEEYQQYIIGRRDLLVPQNIREIRGSFFTPAIWVEKSQEYLEKALGENWQDEYYVWDCAAGTGNLLAGLQNPYNIWASDIDPPNVDTIHALIDEGFNLLHNHVFQFDFLNDGFEKLPKGLKDIIDDPEKRKKLVIYINPPYAEAASTTNATGTGRNKPNVAAVHKTSETYKQTLGRGINELFANFFVRIYHELPNVKLASFSTLKYINSQNFIKFREYFLAEYKGGFICQADTFDNVHGKFPIGFLIWDLKNKKAIKSVKTDVLIYENETQCKKQGVKTFYAINTKSFIIDWLRHYFDNEEQRIGFLRFQGTDFQTSSNAFITSHPTENDVRESKITNITKNNLIEVSISASLY